MTLREKRLQEANATIDRLFAQREACLLTMTKIHAKLVKEKQRAERLKRAAMVIQKMQEPPPLTPEQVAIAKSAQAELDKDIPTFLDRRSAGQKKDDEARAKITAAVKARKKAKTQARIEKMKAKKAGDLTRMPLTGKAALDFIKG